MTDTVPAYAERINSLDILKPKRGPSRFAASVQSFSVNYICAACGADLGELPNNVTVTCKCGLHTRDTINGTMIWRAQPEPVE